jgi:formate dehydrogenase major subunit
LAATFGRGAMTNHWRDIKNADVILINGANPAEAHPVGFQWFMQAKLDPTKGPGKGGGAKLIHVDPRYSRTSAVSDMYARIRTGTDVAYFGGLMNYVLQNNLHHADYVVHYTNASFIVSKDYTFQDGLFSGYDPKKRAYKTFAPPVAPPLGNPGPVAPKKPDSWAYQLGADGFAKRDNTLQDPQCVFQLLKKHYSRYTPEMVATITGIPKEDFLKIAAVVGEMGKPDKVMTIVYAVGLTHHTTGSQLIRSAALLQLLLGNMGRPGGGMNAERGHANIQGNTDNAISWEILPGYLKIPQPGQKTIDDYVKASASKKLDPNSWNFFGTNYKKFMVSLLKSWYGDSATAANDFAFNWIPKPAGNSSWMSIYDQALQKKMEGVMLSGMTASSIGPDSNQVLQALSNLKWLAVMDPFPTTSSEFWHRGAGMDPATIQTEVFMLPCTHWIEKDGSFVNSGRWMQWKDAVLPPQGGAMHDHWIMAELFARVKALYAKNGGKFADPIMHLAMPYKDVRKPTLDEIAREVNGQDLGSGKQMVTFAKLMDDGSTASGNWIYVGSYTPKGNMSKRRAGVQDHKKNDPTGMGFYPQWGWSWPLNRRILYNRASADLAGKPWDPKRPGIKWTGSKWAGDVPDYPPKMSPTDPAAWLPFIMNGEGVGRLFSNTLLDGPLPEHYEPMESPVENALHPKNSASPVAFLYDKAAKRDNRFGTVDEYPIVATTYRLTEHEHYVTQQVELLVQLQPEPFVEIPTGLAQSKSIKTGDMVKVHSKRGEIHVRAVVTNRVGQLSLGDKKVWQVGIPIHWGFVGIAADADPERAKYWMANALTPFVGDANSRTPEFKSFLVQIDKMA